MHEVCVAFAPLLAGQLGERLPVAQGQRHTPGQRNWTGPSLQPGSYPGVSLLPLHYVVCEGNCHPCGPACAVGQRVVGSPSYALASK